MQNVLFSDHSCWQPRCLRSAILGAYHAPVRMQKLVRLKAGRTAVGTGDFEDPDPFPEEALGTDINDQGRRHMAPAAIQADRGATSGMQASGDTHNLLFWLQQALFFACICDIVKFVGKALGGLVKHVLVSVVGADKASGPAVFQAAGLVPLQAHVQSLGRLLRFCWRLMMLSGFYWYLSKPETLPYIAHPVVQTAAWCTALAAAAVYRWSDMALRNMDKEPVKHLVTQGPYAIHRMFLVYTLQAREEEKQLIQRFQNEPPQGSRDVLLAMAKATKGRSQHKAENKAILEYICSL